MKFVSELMLLLLLRLKIEVIWTFCWLWFFICFRLHELYELQMKFANLFSVFNFLVLMKFIAELIVSWMLLLKIDLICMFCWLWFLICFDMFEFNCFSIAIVLNRVEMTVTVDEILSVDEIRLWIDTSVTVTIENWSDMNVLLT